MEIFRIKNLTGGYNRAVLFNINLNIYSGEFIGIIGPNGSGKSTFLKLLTRLLSPFSGDIYYKNQNIYKFNSMEFAQNVSVVFDIDYVAPFKVISFIKMGMFPHNDYNMNKLNEIIKLTNIEKLLNKKLNQLSSGELQRVNVARALVQSTDCIVLDEPVSHLDIGHSTSIMDILKKLNDDGSTIICVLHDINLAIEYCSRIIALKNGKIYFDGKPENCIHYNSIENLFECVTTVYSNPISKKPRVYPVPSHILKSKNK